MLGRMQRGLGGGQVGLCSRKAGFCDVNRLDGLGFGPALVCARLRRRGQVIMFALLGRLRTGEGGLVDLLRRQQLCGLLELLPLPLPLEGRHLLLGRVESNGCLLQSSGCRGSPINRGFDLFEQRRAVLRVREPLGQRSQLIDPDAGRLPALPSSILGCNDLLELWTRLVEGGDPQLGDCQLFPVRVGSLDRLGNVLGAKRDLLGFDLELSRMGLGEVAHAIDPIVTEHPLQHLVSFCGLGHQEFGEPALRKQHGAAKGIEVEPEECR